MKNRFDSCYDYIRSLQFQHSLPWVPNGREGKRKAAKGSAHRNTGVLLQGTSPTRKTLTPHGQDFGWLVHPNMVPPVAPLTVPKHTLVQLTLSVCIQAGLHWTSIHSVMMKTVHWTFTPFSRQKVSKCHCGRQSIVSHLLLPPSLYLQKKQCRRKAAA